MDWEVIRIIVGAVADVLCIASVIISFLLWMSFGKLKNEIEREKVKYIEEREKIVKNLTVTYEAIFTDNKKDDDIISDLRKQIYSIDKSFKKLMIKNDLRHINKLIKTLEKDTDKINLSMLRKHLDYIITSFTEKFYEYQ